MNFVAGKEKKLVEKTTAAHPKRLQKKPFVPCPACGRGGAKGDI
jgi:hypothetical protein